MAKTPAVFNKINTLRERYYKASTDKDALVKLVSEAEVAEQVYNSNAIENSTLSLEETEKILLAIDLDRYISDREIFEAKNLARVVTYIDKRAKEQELTLDVMLALHKMLIANIREDIAGRFRQDSEYVRVGSHIAPAPPEILERLGTMLSEYNAASHESIIKRLAYLEGKKIVTLIEYAKNHTLSHSNLINKATRQTIEAFLEKGLWKIGDERIEQ